MILPIKLRDLFPSPSGLRFTHTCGYASRRKVCSPSGGYHGEGGVRARQSSGEDSFLIDRAIRQSEHCYGEVRERILCEGM
jgi:hypothetical protein